MEQSKSPTMTANQKADSLPFSRTNKISFPVKLYRMLEDTEGKGLAWIVSWNEAGRAFRVHQPKIFVEEIMPHYFRQTKFKSFTRQLNLYGFQRVANRDVEQFGYYFHPRFRKGDKPAGCDVIQPFRKLQNVDNASSKTSAEGNRVNFPDVIGGDAHHVFNLYRILAQRDLSNFSMPANIPASDDSLGLFEGTADAVPDVSTVLSRRDQGPSIAAMNLDPPAAASLFLLENRAYVPLPVARKSKGFHESALFYNKTQQLSSTTNKATIDFVSDVSAGALETFSWSSHYVQTSTSDGTLLTELRSLTKYEFPVGFDFSILEPAPLSNECNLHISHN
jgi:hypothetical protein